MIVSYYMQLLALGATGLHYARTQGFCTATSARPRELVAQRAPMAHAWMAPPCSPSRSSRTTRKGTHGCVRLGRQRKWDGKSRVEVFTDESALRKFFAVSPLATKGRKAF